jgi:uncharacterized protein (DUF1501 family)
MASRREFLKRCCALGAIGAGAQINRFGMMTARAQSSSNYKALVCVFLFGGNDGNNVVVPNSTAGYAAYQSVRQNVALAQASLLPVAAGGTSYGLHPRLINTQRIYNTDKRAALIFNVGMLVRPTTRDSYRRGLVQVPRNLYSHSDQTSQWQTSNPTGGSTGWGGRVTDILSAQNPGSFPAGVSTNGNSLLLSGQSTKPVSISPGDNFGLDSFGDRNAQNAREVALQQILTFDTGVTMISAGNGVLGNALKASQEVNAALNGAPALTTVFPNSGLGQQLAQIAKVIQVRGALGMNRQIFFCGMGGFDNHTNLIADQDNLLNQLDPALNAFYNATAELGVQDSVVSFTESEFGRTGQPSTGAGSDHAWGSNHIAMGGPIKGGAAYGTFPTLALQGPDDTGDRGVWIPTTSLDQYAATFASWFGVNDADLNVVFPNLVNFSAPKLSFL